MTDEELTKRKKEVFKEIMDMEPDEYICWLEGVIFNGALAMGISPSRYCLYLAMNFPKESYPEVIAKRAMDN